MKNILILSLLCWIYPTQLPALEPGTFAADGRADRAQIALTFDDGPGEFTTQILDVLDRYQVKATFFMNGDQVEMRPETAKDVHRRGNEIADHTYSHMNFYAYLKKHGVDRTQEKIHSEITKSKNIIEKTTGASVRICRMPHGFHKPWMKEVAKQHGYALVNWTFGEDWLNISQEKMASNYLKRVKPGTIFLFHDGGRKKEKTLAITALVIEEAKRKNLSIVTVGELLK